ncbi:MAG TPA: glycosyltransferase [Candidatus Saccharimonadales bacterium]|nr:glycosyltransferase [Candidatus Saccharimonadales bacterium]
MTELLFIIDYIDTAHGGTEGQLLMLLRGLDPGRYRVHLACLQDTPWLRELRLEPPPLLLGLTRLASLDGVRRMWRLRRYLRQHRIRLVQTYFDDAFVAGALAGWLAGVPVVACRRNLGPAYWNNRRFARTFRLLRHITARYVANSQATREAIARSEGIPPGRIEVIHNGVDPARMGRVTPELRRERRAALGLAEDELLVGMVAHVRPEKNVELFLEAAARLHRSRPRTRFAVVGEIRPDDQARMDAFAARAGLAGALLTPGLTADVAGWLAAMDIACLTSDGESFSNAILEYQAAGLPVVASAVGGNVEAVEGTGFLFPRGDLEALVGHLERLAGDPQLRASAGASGRRAAAERYDPARMVAAYEAVYRGILGPG